MDDLRKEVERFRRWADHAGRSYGEWETEYDAWPALWDAAEAALERPLDAETIDLLLYALARDNECERICDMLSSHPAAGLKIARAALAYPDPDARWQAAVFLGRQQGQEAADLLRRFAVDSDEYVRRRASTSSSR